MGVPGCAGSRRRPPSDLPLSPAIPPPAALGRMDLRLMPRAQPPASPRRPIAPVPPASWGDNGRLSGGGRRGCWLLWPLWIGLLLQVRGARLGRRRRWLGVRSHRRLCAGRDHRSRRRSTPQTGPRGGRRIPQTGRPRIARHLLSRSLRGRFVKPRRRQPRVWKRARRGLVRRAAPSCGPGDVAPPACCTIVILLRAVGRSCGLAAGTRGDAAGSARPRARGAASAVPRSRGRAWRDPGDSVC